MVCFYNKRLNCVLSGPDDSLLLARFVNLTFYSSLLFLSLTSTFNALEHVACISFSRVRVIVIVGVREVKFDEEDYLK